jgi:hypothetical protein
LRLIGRHLIKLRFNSQKLMIREQILQARFDIQSACYARVHLRAAPLRRVCLRLLGLWLRGSLCGRRRRHGPLRNRMSRANRNETGQEPTDQTTNPSLAVAATSARTLPH